MNKTNKIILILLFLNSFNSYSQENGKAFLNINKNLNEQGNIESVDCLIKNISVDTLIYVNIIYLENIWKNGTGKKDIDFYFMSSDKYYNPNVLYFYDTKSGINIHRDGYTFFNYNNFPKFFSIAPNKEFTIHIGLKNYSNSLNGKDFQIDGTFYLASKICIDSVISNYFPKEKSNYQNSLFERESINYYDFLDSALVNDKDKKISNIEILGRQFQIRTSFRLN